MHNFSTHLVEKASIQFKIKLIVSLGMKNMSVGLCLQTFHNIGPIINYTLSH